VPGIDPSRQRTVSRRQFEFRWPLSVGVGTLACDDGGNILFRTQGVTYGLSGRPAAAADITSLRVPESSPPPSNPLKRLTQNERMEAFEESMRCITADSNDDEGCHRVTAARFRLTPEEWKQIEAEGRERSWPPLTRAPMSLEPLLSAGRALCAPGSGR
jgi:hypothetical protein